MCPISFLLILMIWLNVTKSPSQEARTMPLTEDFVAWNFMKHAFDSTSPAAGFEPPYLDLLDLTGSGQRNLTGIGGDTKTKMKEVSLLLLVATTLAGLRMEVVLGFQYAIISKLRIETKVNHRYAVTHVTSRMENLKNANQELFFKMPLPKTAFVSSLII
ncbi:uncharacterized protein LOC143036473 [Oratosquilla oratoria]|uniref:uncharacterized protein LOC143036473 n=1 Tax=Oratosquilla oratoria TaxID=337810 RepID=UPI003F775999